MLQVQHTMQFPGEYRVEWMSPEETYMHLGENFENNIPMQLIFFICSSFGLKWRLLLKRPIMQLLVFDQLHEKLTDSRVFSSSRFLLNKTFLRLDSAGSKIYRGLVESVGMKKSAGNDRWNTAKKGKWKTLEIAQVFEIFANKS